MGYYLFYSLIRKDTLSYAQIVHDTKAIDNMIVRFLDNTCHFHHNTEQGQQRDLAM